MSSSQTLMPARTIKPSFRSVTGQIPSQKLGRMVAFESTLERDLFVTIEFDFNVRSFEEQPVSIRYVHKGFERSHTPDALIEYEHAGWPTELVQVKYADDLERNWEEYKPGLKAACKYARLRGWRFKILTERVIRTAYLDNAKFLLPFRWRCYTPYDDKRVRDFFEESGPISLGGLKQHIGGDAVAIVYQLLARGKLVCDLDTVITDATVVRLL